MGKARRAELSSAVLGSSWVAGGEGWVTRRHLHLDIHWFVLVAIG